MTFLTYAAAAALLILLAAVILLWRGIRRGHLPSLAAAAVLVLLLAAGYLALLRLITAM